MPVMRLTLAYDGSEFEGWQTQAGARAARTVQAVLEAALARLGGQPVTVAAAGRTDAGVHAVGQVVSFDWPAPWPAERVQRALNGLLPRDLRVLTAAPAPPGFHARRSARAKLYRYELDTGPVQLPTRRRLAAHVPWPLDPARVARTAALYLGRHDFAALRSAGSSVQTSVRTVLRSDARWYEATLIYEVVADGFLRKMVRSMVGGLIAAGRGQCAPEALREALLAGDRRRWPAPAAAHGLTLVAVAYDDAPCDPAWALAPHSAL